MWVFGYGSLLWYTDFPVEKAVPGFVRGYSRRFWQKSPDHRGTPDLPGRTVTLVADPEGCTLGVAYRVPDGHIDATKQYLDWREKAGYNSVPVLFHPSNGDEPFILNVYISPETDDNEHFAGPETVPEIADTVLRARGPSGSNIEYVLNLAYVLRLIDSNAHDPHIFQLEGLVLYECFRRKITDKSLHKQKVPKWI